jgi:Fur family transcriptional regulator, peroxide stress response regulator
MATSGRQPRTTRQLALVLETVRGSGTEHPRADQVFARVRAHLPRISLGTVYRNLQRLAREGRIGVTYLEGRVTRYDPTPALHDHFVCQRCGRIDDLAAVGPPREGLSAARRAGHEVTSHALVLYGSCRDCGPGEGR